MNPENPIPNEAGDSAAFTPRPIPRPAVAQPEASESRAVSPPPVASPTAELGGKIKAQIRRVFLGQPEVLDQVVAAMLAGGHVLLEGKPGLGKTHLVLALAKTFGGEFKRIQFTPDLMPSDVTGHTLYDMGSQTFPGSPWAGVYQPLAGGRGQPRSSQDPVRLVGGDARGASHDRWRKPRSQATVHGLCYAEPH